MNSSLIQAGNSSPVGDWSAGKSGGRMRQGLIHQVRVISGSSSSCANTVLAGTMPSSRLAIRMLRMVFMNPPVKKYVSVTTFLPRVCVLQVSIRFHWSIDTADARYWLHEYRSDSQFRSGWCDHPEPLRPWRVPLGKTTRAQQRPCPRQAGAGGSRAADERRSERDLDAAHARRRVRHRLRLGRHP